MSDPDQGNPWQFYINELLGKSTIAPSATDLPLENSHAAIIGRKGGIWAISEGLTLSADEQEDITRFFPPDGIVNEVKTSLRLGPHKYFTVNTLDENTVVLRKLSDGAVIAKTIQAILFIEFKQPEVAQNAVKKILIVARYLKESGY